MGIISDRETTPARPPRGPKTLEQRLSLLRRELASSSQRRVEITEEIKRLEKQLGINPTK